MIRMQRGAGDPEAEKKKMDQETEMARTASFYNAVSFIVICSVLRAIPLLLDGH